MKSVKNCLELINPLSRIKRKMKTHYVKALFYDKFLTSDPVRFGSIAEAQEFSEDCAKQLAQLYFIFAGMQLGKFEAVRIEDFKIETTLE